MPKSKIEFRKDAAAFYASSFFRSSGQFVEKMKGNCRIWQDCPVIFILNKSFSSERCLYHGPARYDNLRSLCAFHSGVTIELSFSTNNLEF
jgi:hypothetical protein